MAHCRTSGPALKPRSDVHVADARARTCPLFGPSCRRYICTIRERHLHLYSLLTCAAIHWRGALEHGVVAPPRDTLADNLQRSPAEPSLLDRDQTDEAFRGEARLGGL